MTAQINTMKNLQSGDPWEDAINEFGRQYEIFGTKFTRPIDEVIKVDKVKYCCHVPVRTPNYTTHNIVLLNKNKEVVQIFQDVELQDGKMYVKKPLVKPSNFPWSWINWMWRPRTPNVNVNANFNKSKR
jgi:hypothetical protein